MPVHIPLQGEPEPAEQKYLIADPAFLHRLHLAALIGDEPLQPGQLLQKRGLLYNILGQGAIVFRRLCRILVGAGDEQRVQLRLGRGDGDHLYDVFPLGIRPHGRVAADPEVVAHRVADGKSIQQRRDTQLFRQCNRLLYPLYHNRKLQKLQYVCACFLETSVL